MAQPLSLIVPHRWSESTRQSGAIFNLNQRIREPDCLDLLRSENQTLSKPVSGKSPTEPQMPTASPLQFFELWAKRRDTSPYALSQLFNTSLLSLLKLNFETLMEGTLADATLFRLVTLKTPGTSHLQDRP
ncbi:unnamed protein product [Pleuronectes platessa]|uniref:Uncharacterized protein n=1 Tax=Pleuronectes platessa TaxID=8262 RepID=A0A9N7YLL7_PLEPL|nr:unnamed protein product [Pleuronectes platessa]